MTTLSDESISVGTAAIDRHLNRMFEDSQYAWRMKDKILNRPVDDIPRRHGPFTSIALLRDDDRPATPGDDVESVIHTILWALNMEDIKKVPEDEGAGPWFIRAMCVADAKFLILCFEATQRPRTPLQRLRKLFSEKVVLAYNFFEDEGTQSAALLREVAQAREDLSSLQWLSNVLQETVQAMDDEQQSSIPLSSSGTTSSKRKADEDWECDQDTKRRRVA